MSTSDPKATLDALVALLRERAVADDRQRRAQSDAVARALADAPMLAAARRRQQASAFDPPVDTPVDTPVDSAVHRARNAPSPTPRPISIWRPVEREGKQIFERPAPQPFGDHYAERHHLAAEKAAMTRRVCFFGESVAAGYLYAPSLTPAKLLERALTLAATQSGATPTVPGWEVVDLARTNERLDSLVATLEASLQLAPDVLVIFAGNNWTLLESPEWSPYAPSVRAKLDVAEALSNGATPDAPDLWGLIGKAARAVFERVGQALARVAHIADAASIPVVLVVPEVNVADWDSRQPVPWLTAPDGSSERPTMAWHQLYEQAEQVLARALESSDPDLTAGDTLESLVHAMLALDDGLSPTSFRLQAEAHRLRGDDSAAAEACRQEIAACHYATLGFLAAPQASPMAQALMRQAAEHHGFTCVDLPRVFAEATGGALPGNRLFLDYCHLSSEGMNLAMAAVAQAVRSPVGEASGNRPKVPPGAEAASGVAPEVEATARLGAAVHCAHRLISVRDTGPLLRKLLAQAVDASPSVIDTMVDLVDARTAHGATTSGALHGSALHGVALSCPAVMTAAQQRMLGSDHVLGFQHGWRYPYLDVDVLEAILATLEARADPRAQLVREHVLRLAIDRHGVLDLLADGYFLARPLERLFPDVTPSPGQIGRAFLRSPWPTTRFVFVIDQPVPVHLEVTARQPRQNGLASDTSVCSAQLEVEINGSLVATCILTGRGDAPAWRHHAISISAAVLRHGINRLVLRWPLVEIAGKTALAAGVDRLRLGIEADLHPIFGEVAALRCSVPPTKSRTSV